MGGRFGLARSYRSQLDGSILPERPLAVGPGYHQPDGSTPRREAQESR